MKKLLMGSAILLELSLGGVANASVVMLNTRVIYNEGDKSKTVQLTNNDDIPYLVQAWTDVNSSNSTPETADGPFAVSPAISKISPHAGQAIKLIYTGGQLPADKESVFYFNMVQIPPKNMKGEDKNQLVLILKNRAKIFYRPKGLMGSPNDVEKKLVFSLKPTADKWVLTANNPTGYHASLTKAVVINGDKETAFPVDMVPPKSSLSWSVNKSAASLSGASKVKFQFVNDQGGRVSAELPLN